VLLRGGGACLWGAPDRVFKPFLDEFSILLARAFLYHFKTVSKLILILICDVMI